ncbi:GNAT family N-acetyltransferase [Nocardia sp. NPDC055321]
MNQLGAPVFRRATEHDIDDMARIISRAFATDDPIEEYVFPNPADRHRRSPRMLRIMIRHRFLPAGGAAVATIDGEIVGAMLWYPAGYAKSLWREAISGPQLLWAMAGATGRGMDVDAAIAETTPATAHNYLVYLGCEPRVQRSGVGRALVHWLAAESDREQAAVCGICKDANVDYYRAFGFEFVRRARIGRGGPEMNFVLRPPVPVGIG